MQITRPYAAAYLAGLFDGEGTIALSLAKSGKVQLRRISLTNTDKSILDHAGDCLNALDIEHGIFQRNFPTNPKWNTAWDINIYGRRNIVLFCRYIKVASATKRAKLKALRTSYRRAARRYRRFYGGSNYATIVRLYGEGWSLQRIAVHLGTHHEMIRQALIKGGHDRRERFTPHEMAMRRWHRED
jgi:hypothetical protein